MSEPNPIKVDMTVAESVQRVDMGVSESGQQIPMTHSEVVINTSTDYDDLFHKPHINGVELVGDLDSSDLGLQSALEFDDSPTSGSNNPVKSGGIYSAIPKKVSDLTNDSGFVNASGAASAAPVQSVNGQTGAVTLTIPTVPTKVSDLTNDAGYITGTQVPSNETDPTVPAWAKAASKPSYTASEVGALPSNTPIHNVPSGGTTGQVLTKSSNSDYALTWSTPSGSVSSVNGQTCAVVLDAEDVGALPDSTTIPSKTIDLVNDSGFLTLATLPIYNGGVS